MTMIETTVIGSYPPVLDAERHLRLYRDGEFEDAGRRMIDFAVKRQLEAGVDIVSDGQVRGDFIRVFARNFRGIALERRPVVYEEIEMARHTTVEDARYVKENLPEGKSFKGILTGPYTLALSCENQHYKSVEELAFAFAENLRGEAGKLFENADFVQIDEPFYSVDYPDYAGELVEEVFRDLKSARLLHVCGDVSDIFGDLTNFPVDCLEHEFAANPHLLETVCDYSFKQRIGFGCVRSDSTDVEEPGEIGENVSRAIDCLGAEKIWLNPDCGLRNMPEQTSFQKLKNMCEARDLIAGASKD